MPSIQILLEPKSMKYYAREAAMTIRERIKAMKWEDIHPKHHLDTIFMLINSCYLILGVASVVTGIWLFKERDDFLELTPAGYAPLSSAGFCVFSGLVICVIVIVGIYGVNAQSKKLIITYIVFVGFLITIQLVVGFFGFYTKQGVREQIKQDMKQHIKLQSIKTRNGQEMNITLSWSHLQRSLQCCGIDGPSDWHFNNRWPKNRYVPDSCCKEAAFDHMEADIRGCGKHPNAPYIYQNGCYEAFADWLFINQHIVSTNCAVLLIFEAAVLAVSWLIFQRINGIKKAKSDRKKRKDLVTRARSVSESVAIMDVDLKDETALINHRIKDEIQMEENGNRTLHDLETNVRSEIPPEDPIGQR
ncbi:unnamed protein product, partial [Mesorhabditis belari]|uniref:Tetraspanin n=1 Tax=Mesorhabditis belari TaxID=2138241 RepID=A0AAF3FLH5_9BILA